MRLHTTSVRQIVILVVLLVVLVFPQVITAQSGVDDRLYGCIAFIGDTPPGLVDGIGGGRIGLVNPGGGGVRYLSTGNASEHKEVVWSSNGDWLAFIANDDSHGQGYDQVYIIRPDGTNVHQITMDATHKSSPIWSPDDRTIAFISSDLFIMVVQVFDIQGHFVPFAAPHSLASTSGSSVTHLRTVSRPSNTKRSLIAYSDVIGSNIVINVIDWDGQRQDGLTLHTSNAGAAIWLGLDWAVDGVFTSLPYFPTFTRLYQVISIMKVPYRTDRLTDRAPMIPRFPPVGCIIFL